MIYYTFGNDRGEEVGDVAFSLRPHRVLDSYRRLTPELLQGRGVKLLLCDLDYTLAPKRVPEPDDDVRAWIASLREAGITVAVVSNNRSPVRVERFCRTLGIPYVGHAGKPGTRGYRQAMARFGAAPSQTAALGDKLLTDMLAANRAGIWAIMVEPLGGPVGAWNHVLHLLQRPFKALRKEK